MDTIKIIYKIFNTRELSLGIWIFISICYLLLNKHIRKSLFNVIKAAFNPLFIKVYIHMILYVFVITYFLYLIGFWNTSLLKDTILWFISTGIISAFRAVDKGKNFNYFIELAKDYVKITIILEFIINLYTFSLIGELILIPFVFFINMLIIILDTFPEYQNEKSEPTKKLLKFINAILGLYIIFNSILLAIKNIKDVGSISNLNSLLLPPILSLLFLVFIYFLALWASYEEIFTRIQFGENKSKKLIAYIQFKIFLLCHVNINRVNNFWKLNGLRVLNIKNNSDFLEVISNHKQYYNIK